MRYIRKKRLYNLLLLIIILGFMGLFIVYPHITFEGAVKGIESWLKVVFPSLLPFFIGAEIMISIGVVDFMSVLLSPIMRPLFGCSGNSSFVWAMSAVSGYPTSARLVSSLIGQKKIDHTEAQRILSFTSTSGPLFMLGAIGIGMLNSPKAGKIIAISHYLSAFIIGLFFKYYGRHSKHSTNPPKGDDYILQDALDSMSTARQRDNRSFGQILSDSIISSFQTLTIVGGFLILFSALIHLLVNSSLMGSLSSDNIVVGVLSGMIEMTTGSAIISQSSSSIGAKITGICFIIGWSGLSVHFQVISLVNRTNISIGLYLVTKLLHGIISAVIGWSIAKLVYVGDITTFNPIGQDNFLSFNFITRYSLKLFFLALFAWVSIAIVLYLFLKRSPFKK